MKIVPIAIAIILFYVFPLKALQVPTDEGEDPIVWKLSFEGNDNFRSMVLRQVIATERPAVAQKLFRRYSQYRFDETEVRRDRIRLQNYYQRRGFLDVSVEYEIIERRKEWQKEVVFRINEGRPTRIRSVNIEIDADEQTKNEIRESRIFQRAINNHSFVQGNRYQSIQRSDVEGHFLQTIGNLGYAWPEVRIESELDAAANRADITIKLTPNTKTYFSEFAIEGDLSVPERVVLRQSGLKEGQMYSRDAVRDAQRSIFNHHLFRFATITIPEQEQDSTLSILLRVREHPKRTVETSIGFGQEDLLRGQASWRHRNINGTGHRFGVNARASFIEQRLSTDYLVPYIFNPRSSNVTSLFGLRRLEPAFELFQGGFNNSFIYQVNRNSTASASYEYSVNEELSRDPDASLPDTVLNYNTSSFLLSGYYSEGFLREQRGWVVQPTLELSGIFREATFSFQRLTVDVRRFTPITNALTFAARINAGGIFYDEDDTLPSNLRFFSGGTNSIRGWGRQQLGPSRPVFDSNGEFDGYVPIGGRAAFTFNFELRQDIGEVVPNFGLAAFLDGGQVWRTFSTIDERPIQFGAGGGIRYHSPIGPIRVDVAYKLNPTDQDLNIFDGVDYGSTRDRIGIHFSIGQAF